MELYLGVVARLVLVYFFVCAVTLSAVSLMRTLNGSLASCVMSSKRL